MFFSVIIPVYNRPEPVKHAIQSVLNQEYQDWECIVVDDASTDNTAQVCAELAEKDPRIHIYSLESNSGVSAARNYGIDHISKKGGYILFLDSDDSFMPTAMQTLSNIISKNDVEMTAFPANQSGLPFNPPYYQILDRDWIRQRSLPQHLNAIPKASGFLEPYVWNKCYKSSLILDYSIRFDVWRRTWEDNAFLVQCLNQCESMLLIPDEVLEPCSYPGIDHLSTHIDTDLFLNYIAGYDNILKQFGKEYEFDNDYTSKHYFEVIHSTLISYVDKCDEMAFCDSLQSLIENQTMQEWVKSIKPSNADEMAVLSEFKKGNCSSLLQIYRDLASNQERERELEIHGKHG